MIVAFLFLSLLVCGSRAQSNGDVRLVGSTLGGRVEIFLNSVWGTVCNDFFAQDEADTVCHQLGYESASNYGTAIALGYSTGTGSIFLDDVDCSSSNRHILQCSNSGIGEGNCVHDEDVAVECSSSRLDSDPFDGQVRLVTMSDSFSSQGIVEVYCNGEWGTVCGDADFDSTDALVICKQLGYNAYTDYSSIGTLSTASSSQPIWLDKLSCSDDNECVLDCQECFASDTCDHTQDVYLTCSYDEDITDINTGTLESCMDESDSDDYFDPLPIIFGVVGGVMGLFIILFIVGFVVTCCYNYKRYRQERRTQELSTNFNLTGVGSSVGIQPGVSSGLHTGFGKMHHTSAPRTHARAMKFCIL